ncbi:MAG: glycosyltransferase family 39 protein [Planctomycetaceae bacterium]
MTRCVSLAILIGLCGVLLPPAYLVTRYLPDQYADYHDRLLFSLRLTKCFLIADAALLAAWPVLRRRYFDQHHEPSGLSHRLDPAYTRTDYLLAGALAITAALLRLPGLSTGFSYDELTISMSMSEKSLPHLLMRAEPWRLVSAITGFVLYKLFGVSEVAARTTSYVAGVLTVPALYLLARRWAGTAEALAAASILALSTFHVWYSQFSTSYAPALFCIVLSMWALESSIAADQLRRWGAWAATVFLGLLVNFQVMLFVLVAQAFRVAFPVVPGPFHWRQVRQAGVLCLYAGASVGTLFSMNFFLWCHIVSGLTGSSDANLLMNEPRGDTWQQVELFARWVANEYAPWPLQLAVITLIVIGLFVWSKRDSALSLYLVLPTVIFWSMFVVEIIRRVTPRHSIFTLVPSCIFAGTGAVTAVRAVLPRSPLGIPIARAVPVYVLILAALSGSAYSLYHHWTHEPFPYRVIGKYVARNVPDHATVYFGGFGYPEYQYYYRPLRLLPDYAALSDVMDADDDYWIVYFYDSYVAQMPDDLRSRFLAETTLLYEFSGRSEQMNPQVGFVRKRATLVRGPETAGTDTLR